MSGPPVVLVHGPYGTLDDPALVAELDAAATLSPDLLGYGTQAAHSAATLEEQADHVAAATAHLPRPAVLVGHSLGGAVGVLVAERHPHRVAGLVSIEGNMAPGGRLLHDDTGQVEQRGGRPGPHPRRLQFVEAFA